MTPWERLDKMLCWLDQPSSIGRMVEKFINRKKTCIEHGCKYQEPSVHGDLNLCLICRLPLGVSKDKIMENSGYDLSRCSPLMGFEQEEQVPAQGSVCGHTRGL